MRLLLTAILLFAAAQGCIETESRGENDDPVLEPIVAPKKSDVETPTVESGFKSLLGNSLERPALSKKERAKRGKSLATALENYNSNPDSLENIVWFGRRLAYLYDYHESINIYSEGLSKFPESYQLYRHRGHRYITIRQFDKAIDDLEKAAFYVRDLPTQIEKDGLPNRRNIPRTSVQFNIWYHLGLAYYLKGNFDKAISAYKKCLNVSGNDDMLVATTDWFYMTYRKIGNLEAAKALLEPISKRMNLMENYAYHNRLLMYKGLKQPEDLFNISNTEKADINLVTQGYGVANWYYYHGDVNKAIEIFEKVTSTTSWHAFGYLAAEVELFNIRQSQIL